MSKHPSPKALEGFLLGRLNARQAKVVVLHLLSGCPRCRNLVAPLAEAMFRPGRRTESQPSNEIEQAYEDAVSAASSIALAHHRSLVHERSEAEGKVTRLLYGKPPEEPEFWTVALCEALLEKVPALRHRDPRGMLHLAKLATEATHRLSPARYGDALVADLQARTLGELANAFRVNDSLASAEFALARALEASRLGTGDSLLRARLCELAASLLCDQRQFPGAFRLLDLAHSLYKRKGDVHCAGRALIKRGVHTGRSGDPEEAVRLLARGLQYIDRARDPKLVFLVLHNLLLFRVELGEYQVAQRQLWEMRPLYRHYSDRIALIKLRWIEGRIFFGLGKLDHAEWAFGQARKSFEREGLRYDSALVSFDLAGVWLVQGRKAEVHRLVSEMLETFRARYIAREAIASLLMLREAVNRNEATVDLFQMVSNLFKGLREEPKAQSDPG